MNPAGKRIRIGLMERTGDNKNILAVFYLVTAVLAVTFTLLIASSLVLFFHHERRRTIDMAKGEALATFNKDQAFRFWATKHGGVYVPATKHTMPNPYLSHVLERDITTPSGKHLTLMNPAYMMKQTMTEYYEQYGRKGHITSLKPLNPLNSPDTWERKALEALGRGEKEVIEIDKSDGRSVLRFMKPMLVQEGCLKCHGIQGYKLGDIRGGVGVSVPMDSYLATEKGNKTILGLSCLLVWSLGISGIGFGFVKGRSGIIARTISEEKLKLALAYNRSLIEASPDPLVTIDADGRITDVNAATEKVTGCSREELVGNSFSGYFTKPEEAEESYRQAFREGIIRDHELGIRHRDGHVTPFLYSDSIYRDDTGGIVGVFAAARDITDRKRAEDEIRRLNEELEQRVLDRTAQLEATNRELEAFSYSVSHDLRAPLRAIDGFSQALLEDCFDTLDEKGKEHLQRIRNGTRRMDMLIDALLKLTRFTRSELNPVVTDLSLIARLAADELRKTEPERRVTLRIADGLACTGDPNLLRVVMDNLLGNAWKFTGKKTDATIEFGMIEVDGAPAYFVRDNGAGFDMAYADKLFKSFQRLHLESEFSGTGIGLSLVQRIIHRHGGEVWAEGAPGKGATFYFTLGGLR